MALNDNFYTDFQLGDKQLFRDFKGKLYCDDVAKRNLTPSKTINTEAIPSQDGEVPYSVTYNPRPIPLKIYINDINFNPELFTNWINKKEARWFNYIGDDKKIKVMVEDEINLDAYNPRQGLLDMNLIAHNPYYSYIEDSVFIQANPNLNTVYKFNNKGNDKSFPIITLKCEGQKQNIIFEINGFRMKISNLNTDIIIDCENESVYNYVGQTKVYRMNEYEYTNGFKYTFPKLNIGENTFKLIGGIITEVKIQGNSRFI